MAHPADEKAAMSKGDGSIFTTTKPVRRSRLIESHPAK
jgi:hypothetical protein